MAAVVYILLRGDEGLALLAGVPWDYVLLTVGFQALYLLTQAERYRYVIEDHSDTRLARGHWLRTFLIGRLLNSAIAQGGNLYRGMALSRSHNIEVKHYLSSLAGYSWMTLAVSLVVASAYAVGLIGTERIGTAIGIFGVTLVVISAPFVVRALSTVLPRGLRERRFVRGMADVIDLLVRGSRNPKLLAAFLGQSLIAFALGAGIVMIAFGSVDFSVPLGVAATYLAFLQVSNAIVITPGNIGVQELGFAALSGLVASDAADKSVGAALIVRASGIIATVLFAGVIEVWWRLRSDRVASDQAPIDRA